MKAITFTVPGEPIAKARHRMRRGADGIMYSYTDAKTREGTEQVAWAYRRAAGGGPPNAADAFTVLATFYVSPGGQHPDVDNFAKLVMDALNGLAWHDDRQVTDLHAAVRHNSGNPRTLVTIETNDQELPRAKRPPRRGAKA